jgi:hypothetical protein
MKQTTAYILIFALGFAAAFMLRNCSKIEQTGIDNQPLIDSLKSENNALLDEVFDLEDKFLDLDSINSAHLSTYYRGKETIKILKEKVIITDTVIIRYTDALEAQIKECDTVIETQGEMITNLEAQNGNLKEVVANDSTIIEALEKDIKKKKRKIFILKIERVLYPVAVAVGLGYLFVNSQN